MTTSLYSSRNWLLVQFSNLLSIWDPCSLKMRMEINRKTQLVLLLLRRKWDHADSSPPGLARQVIPVALPMSRKNQGYQKSLWNVYTTQKGPVGKERGVVSFTLNTLLTTIKPPPLRFRILQAAHSASMFCISRLIIAI